MKKIEKKKMYMVFGIVVLIIAIAGSAYAYYSAMAVDKTTVSGTVAGGANLELKVEKITTGATGNLIPVDNDTTTLTKAVIGEGNSNKEDSKRCIDKNGYTACQIYKITLTNKSSVSVNIDGGVTLSGKDTPNIECAVMDDINTVSNNKSCKGNKTLAKDYNMRANESVIYYMMVYIKNINSAQTDTGLFTGTVFFNISGNKIESSFSDDPALNTLTNLGLEVDTEHTPDFTTVSGNSGIKMDLNSGDTLATGLGDGTNGIYKAEDDLGTSYYFRGNVQNNYVYFANNWFRIIRINGDGTIRMIYTGDPNNSSSLEYISESKFNSNNNDNAYVGYMYGTAGSSTYADTHKNTNNSTIKGVIDEWYQNNLSDYSQYIADAIYCNDREVVTGTFGSTTYSGNGSGINQTAYVSVKRNYVDHNPTLKCTNTNDRFTTSSSLGNGALTYPIGLITTDEVVMAGGAAVDYATMTFIGNDSYYLFPKEGNYWYWTMTPFIFQADSDGAGGDAFVDFVDDVGIVSYGDVHFNSAARPVVTLVSDAISGGDGTSGNPFYVGSAPSS